MTVNFRRSIGAAFIFFSAAQMAQAQVTAQDVWTDWKDYMSGYGYDVTGSESMSGDTLTINDLSMTMPLPQDEGEISIDLSSLVFTGNSDGTVGVTMSSTMPLRISGTEEGDEFDVVVNYTQSGVSLIVSGSPNAMNYNYTASQVDLALASLTADGEVVPPDMLRAVLTMTNVISSTQMKLGDMRDYSQRMSADSLTYDLAFNDPESDDAGALNGSVVGVSFQGSGKLPLEMDTDDFQAMLDAGFAVEGMIEYASSSSNMNGADGGDEFSFSNSSQGGKLGLEMDASRVAYDVGQKGTSITVTTNQLPFPVAIEMAEIGFQIDAPVSKSDDDQDFSFVMAMRELTISDMIWGMVDPGSVLPRDPATFVLDLSGKAKIVVDFLDPDIAENMQEAPGELNALTINELLVSAAGAKLAGKGDFTFDNSDLASFDGIPAPTGVANLELSGANGLMDKLIQLGMMSDNDAMGARMMMGMLAVPGDGDDVLKSKIEVTGDGQILANGQRIK